MPWIRLWIKDLEDMDNIDFNGLGLDEGLELDGGLGYWIGELGLMLGGLWSKGFG